MTWDVSIAIIGAVAFLAAWLGIKVRPRANKPIKTPPWDAWWQ